MSKYYVLVVIMVILVISSLHLYGLKEAKHAEQAVDQKPSPTRVVTPSKVKYLQYTLFKTSDKVFHFSYPEEWLVIDTTSDEKKKQSDIVQAWNLKDRADKWALKADFKERKTSNNLQRLAQGVCSGKSAPCERKVVNGITYSRTEELSLNGNLIITYETLNGDRVMNIVTTIKRENLDEYIDEWLRIEQTFRFFK